MRNYRFAGLAALLLAVAAAATTLAQVPQRPKQLVVLDVPAPRLSGLEKDWLNTDGKPVGFERGKVYIVHFWTFGCINCKRNLPAYQRWYRKYQDAAVEVIGVHTPELERERDVNNVREAVRKEHIRYPVLIDGQSRNWRRWRQQWWPTVYLIDKRGHVRYYWTGELEWEDAGGTAIMEGYLDALLREPDPPRDDRDRRQEVHGLRPADAG